MRDQRAIDRPMRVHEELARLAKEAGGSGIKPRLSGGHEAPITVKLAVQSQNASGYRLAGSALRRLWPVALTP